MSVEIMVLISLFASLFLTYELNVQYWIKVLFRIKLTTEIKPIDCLKCFGFWLSLIAFQDLIVSMYVFVILFVIDNEKNK